MRTTLSFLVAALAGLLAVLATAGALVDEATHRPELLRGVTEQVAVDPEVRAAVPGVIDDVVHDAVPEQVPGPLAQAAEDLLRPLAQRVADDPQVVQGWSDTADEARRAWLAQLEDPQGADEPGSGADVTIPFGPVAQSGITAALGDIERDLREDRFDLPGQALLETIVGADVGDWAADTLLAPLYDRAADLRDSTALRTRLADAEARLGKLETQAELNAPVVANSPTGDAARDLAAAIRLLSEDRPRGERALETVVVTWPNTPQAREANSRLGDLRVAANDKAGAVPYYAAALKDWPRIGWAAETTLKLADALVATDRDTQGCAALAEFNRRYAETASATLKARAGQIRTAAGCD